jgi:hypothetical protein
MRKIHWRLKRVTLGFLKNPLRNLPLAVGAIAWFLSVGVGGAVLLRYANTPGQMLAAPIQWPSDSPIKPLKALARLVIFIHPHCPCSRATIRELAIIMANCRGRVQARVLFIAPSSFDTGWVKTDLWRSAEGIPGVIPLEDHDGTEARRFGATTSGQTMLYDERGNLLFQGGITISRGHEGPNDGVDAIISFVMRGSGRRTSSRVFGCSLKDTSQL